MLAFGTYLVFLVEFGGKGDRQEIEPSRQKAVGRKRESVSNKVMSYGG